MKDLLQAWKDSYWYIRYWLWLKTDVQWFLHPIHKKLLNFGPPETIDEAIENIQTVIPFGPTTNVALSVTGEPYKEYALGILYPDDEKRKALIHAMVNTIKRQILLEPLPYKASLYWRLKPRFFTDDDDKKERGYMRFLVSHKPAIYSTHGN